jgi:hypothetical protein
MDVDVAERIKGHGITRIHKSPDRSIGEMTRRLALLFILLAVVAPACTHKFQTAYLDTEEEIRQFENSGKTPCPVRFGRNVDESRVPSTYSEVICEEKKKSNCIQLVHKLETRLLMKNGTCKTKFVEQRVGYVPGKAAGKSKSVNKVPKRS